MRTATARSIEIAAYSRDHGIAEAAKFFNIKRGYVGSCRFIARKSGMDIPHAKRGRPLEPIPINEGGRVDLVAPKTVDRRLQIVQDSNEYGTAKTAEMHGMTEQAVAITRSRVLKSYRHYEEFKDLITKIRRYAKTWDTFPELTGDWMIWFDGHVPFIHFETMLRAMEVADEYGIDDLLLPGDWFDFEDLSKFDFGGFQTDAAEELSTGREMLERLRRRFRRIVLLRGNHEERLVKFLKRIQRAYESDPDLAKYQKIIGREPSQTAWHQYKDFLTSEGIEVSNDPLAFINDDIVVVHPSSMSNMAPNVEEVLTQKYHRHVVGGHVHNLGIRTCRDGKTLAIRVGGLVDAQRCFYKQKRVTVHYEWVNSFAWVKDGKIGVWMDNQSWINPVAEEVLQVGREA